MQEVSDFMLALKHPLHDEIDAVRTIIKKADKKIAERIKWNAPSFFYIQDIATIHVKAQQHVMLIFHHPVIVKIKSQYLVGDYKDRRMMYFKDMDEIKSRKAELKRIVKELVSQMEVPQ